MASTPRLRPTAAVSSDVIRSSGRVMRNVFLNERRHSVFLLWQSPWIRFESHELQRR